MDRGINRIIIIKLNKLIEGMGNCNFVDLSLDKANDILCQQSLKLSKGRKENSLRYKLKNAAFP